MAAGSGEAQLAGESAARTAGAGRRAAMAGRQAEAGWAVAHEEEREESMAAARKAAA